jgi:hypothetical protein
MSRIPKPDGVSRESSFARSFYQTVEDPSGTEALESVSRIHSSPPRSPMPAARRKTHMHARGGESSRRLIPHQKDVQPIERHNNEAPAKVAPIPRKLAFEDVNTQTRQNHFPPEDNVLSTFDDKDVLEQYRIMAQHEASVRAKENFGFDVTEYEKRRRLISSEHFDHQNYYGMGSKSKIKLPPPQPVLATPIPALKPEEPPMPPSTTSWNASKYLDPRIRQPRDPDLGLGTSVRGGATIPHDEHVVRCLGCRGQLRVKLTATLVQCPECSTVSPASSTRR